MLELLDKIFKCSACAVWCIFLFNFCLSPLPCGMTLQWQSILDCNGITESSDTITLSLCVSLCTSRVLVSKGGLVYLSQKNWVHPSMHRDRQWAKVSKVTDVHWTKPHGFPSNSSNWNSYKCIGLHPREKLGRNLRHLGRFLLILSDWFVTKLYWLALSPLCWYLVCICKALGELTGVHFRAGEIGLAFCLAAAI